MQPRPLAIGDLVAGRFRIDALLGEGGMGVVYRATQIPLERPVALKVMRDMYSGSSLARDRFRREARVASALRHPSAVEIYDFGEDGGSLFLAMELLHGEPLAAVLERGPLPVPQAVEVARQTADVLVAAHGIGLVHRDLKPENLFLEAASAAGSRVVVVDFGLAFIGDREGTGRLTEDGLVAGTPAYLPPEQARGATIGPPADIYALGCILFEMVTGSPPFEGRGAELAARHMYAPPPTLRERRRDLELPTALEDLTVWMLAKAPHERPTAVELRTLLTALTEEIAAPAPRTRATGERRARMVPAAARAQPAPAEGGLRLAVTVPLADDAVVALAASGISVEPLAAGGPAGAAAIYAPAADGEALAAAMAHGVPVLTDDDGSDLSRVTELVRAGVDVVLRPVDPAELARKVSQAVRRAAGRKRR